MKLIAEKFERSLSSLCNGFGGFARNVIVCEVVCGVRFKFT